MLKYPWLRRSVKKWWEPPRPQMDVSTPSPPSSKAGECPRPLNTCYHAWEQEELSSEKIGESQRWSLYLLWWLCIYPGEKIGHNEIWTVNRPWNNRDLFLFLKQGVLHLWSKFGNSWVTHKHTNTHSHTQTYTDNDNTQRSKLASGKTCSIYIYMWEHNISVLKLDWCWQYLSDYMLF